MTAPIGYVLLEFPRYSETFILNELLALRRHGLPHRVFCLRGRSDLNAIPPELSEITEFLSEDGSDVELHFSELARLYEERPQQFIAALAKMRHKHERRAAEKVAKRREPLWLLACALSLAARCQKYRIAHLHAHYANQPAEVAELAARLIGCSFSFTGHAKDIFTMKPARLAKIVSRAKFVVGCSQAGVEHLRQGHQAQPVAAIENKPTSPEVSDEPDEADTD